MAIVLHIYTWSRGSSVGLLASQNVPAGLYKTWQQSAVCTSAATKTCFDRTVDQKNLRGVHCSQLAMSRIRVRYATTENTIDTYPLTTPIPTWKHKIKLMNLRVKALASVAMVPLPARVLLGRAAAEQLAGALVTTRVVCSTVDEIRACRVAPTSIAAFAGGAHVKTGESGAPTASRMTSVDIVSICISIAVAVVAAVAAAVATDVAISVAAAVAAAFQIVVLALIVVASATVG